MLAAVRRPCAVRRAPPRAVRRPPRAVRRPRANAEKHKYKRFALFGLAFDITANNKYINAHRAPRAVRRRAPALRH